MYFKSLFSVPIAILISVLHVGCCILPLITIAAASITGSDIFIRFKPLLSGMQLLLLGYLLWRLIRKYIWRKAFHSNLENIAYHASFLIAAAGLYIGYFEPFRSENQRLAQQQFQFFKTHRQLEFNLTGDFVSEKLIDDLGRINGVKAGRIRIDGDLVSLTFKSDVVSGEEVIRAVRAKGYKLSFPK